MSEKPTIRIRRTEKGTLRLKLPAKGARWHGAYKNLDEAVKATIAAGLEPPFLIDYVLTED